MQKISKVPLIFSILLCAGLVLAPTINSNFIPNPIYGPGSFLSHEIKSSTYHDFPIEPSHQSFLKNHIDKTLRYIYLHIHRDTYLADSLPGDKRLHHWSVTYDDAMRIILHVKTGDIESAKKSLDYFLKNKAIQKIGWVREGKKWTPQPGWIVNIIDSAESRAGGRGIEHIAHVGPNIYLGIASLHLYKATGEKKYLQFAKSRWDLAHSLQNEDPQDFNYGGIRMGPWGDPLNPQEQRINFKDTNPSFHELYNGEHAADYKAFSQLLTIVDPENFDRYHKAIKLIEIWDKKIYDPRKHLFCIGTTEKRFYEDNVGAWMNPGVMPIYPLDTNALKISAYGVEGLNAFESDAALKIRKAIDDNYKVTVVSTIDKKPVTLTGYDFVTHDDRKRLILFEEEGPDGDIKIKKGIGRDPLLTDEWSTWVAFADLRLAKDFKKAGFEERAKSHFNAYRSNAYLQGTLSGDPLDEKTIAYPYAHPISYGFNKPVGFGWNTHHSPYSMIGGVARILGILGCDPFNFDQGIMTYIPTEKFKPPYKMADDDQQGLVTEAEVYINKAWIYVKEAQKRAPDEAESWKKAIAIIDQMTKEHADWVVIAEKQNLIAKNSETPFPYMEISGVTIEDLEPVFRKYWALYHIGTGEFIRMMAYKELAYIAKEKNDAKSQTEYNQLSRMSAARIVKKFTYAQAWDNTGWLWQPVRSLKEYFDDYDVGI